MDRWRQSEFIDTGEEPLGPLANLVDIMLVFSCGLIAALVAISPELQQHFDRQKIERDITLGKELPALPEKIEQQRQAGDGYQSLGQVYRDPKTGKLILVGE